MMTWIFLLCVIEALASVAALAFVLGWLFTEHWRPLLPWRPFNCRPCLTFWLTVVLSLGAAVLLAPLAELTGVTSDRLAAVCGIAGAGALVGLNLFQFLKNQYRIYE